MANQKKVRTLTLSDEVFNGLKTAAMAQNTSASKIIEALAREYLETHATEIHNALQQKMAAWGVLKDTSGNGAVKNNG